MNTLTLLKEHTLVHEHARTRAWTHTRALRSTHSCMNTHTLVHEHAHTRAWTRSHSCMNTLTLVHEHSHTRAWTRSHSCINTLALVPEHTHTRPWTRSHSCLNTHTLVHEHVLKLENTGYYEIFRHCFQMLRRALPISCRCFWARVVITYFHDGFTQKYITFWRQQVKIKLNIVYIFTKMLCFKKHRLFYWHLSLIPVSCCVSPDVRSCLFAALTKNAICMNFIIYQQRRRFILK